MLLAAVFSLAFLLGLILTPVGVRVAWATAYLDHPEARKLHTTATALLGGGVVFASALLTWWLLCPVAGGPRPSVGSARELLLLLAGALIALGFGLWDDRFGMRPPVKLAGQGAAAACALATGYLPGMGLPAPLEWVLVLVLLVALMKLFRVF